MLNKDNLRQQMRKRRNVLTNEELKIASNKLLTQLKPLLAKYQKIALYYAQGKEANINAIINDILNKQKVIIKSAPLLPILVNQFYLPIAFKTSKIMRFELINSAQRQIFYEESYQLTNEIETNLLDLVLVPVLAVDRCGFRLGQGGGYYDATFANYPGKLCGIGYDWQIITEVPRQSWDLQLDYFISPSQFLQFKNIV